MRIESVLTFAAASTLAAMLLSACSGTAGPQPPAGASLLPASRIRAAVIPARHPFTPYALPPASVVRPVGGGATRCAGNSVYIADHTNSVIDSFGPGGGLTACTITAIGLSAPIGLWVNPNAGPFFNSLFAANGGSGDAVEYTTPIGGASAPKLRFRIGGTASDVVQDIHRNVYVAEFDAPQIYVFKPPFGGCAYPAGCTPSYVINDPCGAVYFLATDAKGNVYADNFCGFVAVFAAPITAGMTGAPLAGTAFSFPGGMIVDRHGHLLVADQGPSGTITDYIVDVATKSASVNYSFPYQGDVVGIGLNKRDTFVWAANVKAVAGERFANPSGLLGPTATDPTIVAPFGAAARPSSPE